MYNKLRASNELVVLRLDKLGSIAKTKINAALQLYNKKELAINFNIRVVLFNQ
ncbi:MAG TPA: hypothetical protein VKR58_05395 [Aquella sp.]|nr:hypothetical protein [Aquella sp.]